MNDPPDILPRRGAPPASTASSTGGQHFVITSPMQQVTLSQVSYLGSLLYVVHCIEFCVLHGVGLCRLLYQIVFF